MHHPGRHFMLNPGFEHAQAFSSDDVNCMLAGQFEVPGAPAAESKPPAAPVTPAAAKLPELDLPEPVRLETKPLQSQPLPAVGLSSAPAPPARPIFSFDDSFVFNQAPAQTPASVKPVAADQRPVPAAAPADLAARAKPSPVKIDLPEVSPVPAAAKPAELESAAPKRPVPEKAATLRTAAAGALAAVR